MCCLVFSVSSVPLVRSRAGSVSEYRRRDTHADVTLQPNYLDFSGVPTSLALFATDRLDTNKHRVG